MSIHRRLALRIVNQLMPTGHACNLRLTIGKLMRSCEDCGRHKFGADSLHSIDGANTAKPEAATKPCDQVFIAVIQATISAFKIGCGLKEGASDKFISQLQLAGLDAHEDLILVREMENPTSPRGLTKIQISEEASVAVFSITAYILAKNGQAKPAYLRELAEALDINPLFAERLNQTAKQSVNERRSITKRAGLAPPELMLA